MTAVITALGDPIRPAQLAAALPVHPFPARMAPEFALNRLPSARRRRDVLDPMMGSGTIPVLAAVAGHVATGFDSDPLALLIAETWGRPLDGPAFLTAATAVVERARELGAAEVPTEDVETRRFIDRWFDQQAQGRLSALATAIVEQPTVLHRALWCAFSRMIITKDAGASRARDVSHSRPHRVRDKASFDPVERFERSAREVQQRHATLGPVRPEPGQLSLGAADARCLPLEDDSIDAILTSPPYLVAIDYLRGHRLSLVWKGHTVGELRKLRGSSIGSERGLRVPDSREELIAELLGDDAPGRATAILRRYASDMSHMLSECMRVVRSNGHATLVVADATLMGRAVSVSTLIERLAGEAGFRLHERTTRTLPADRRYLPPPSEGQTAQLDRRMRVEVCLDLIPG